MCRAWSNRDHFHCRDFLCSRTADLADYNVHPPPSCASRSTMTDSFAVFPDPKCCSLGICVPTLYAHTRIYINPFFRICPFLQITVYSCPLYPFLPILRLQPRCVNLDNFGRESQALLLYSATLIPISICLATMPSVWQPPQDYRNRPVAVLGAGVLGRRIGRWFH
jgi:hypothetical protein